MSGDSIKRDKQRRASSDMDARRAFCIIGITGMAGVLVDLDHPVSWFLNDSFGTNLPSRLAHTPLLLIAGCIVVCVCAHIGRLYFRHILSKKERTSD